MLPKMCLFFVLSLAEFVYLQLFFLQTKKFFCFKIFPPLLLPELCLANLNEQ